MFKSTDAGATWTAANTGLPVNSTGRLAIDPLTPTTLYAEIGGGVFKSTDAGGTWTATNMGLPVDLGVFLLANTPITNGTLTPPPMSTTPTPTPTHAAVVALAIDPITPRTLYAGTDSGVFKSTDAGGIWTAGSKGLPVDSHVWALAIDPITPSTLYAGGYSGMFKSTDGGASWSTFNTGLTNANVRALAIDPLTPSTLYAGTDAGMFDIEQDAAVPCAGDCNNDQAVTIDELLTMVNSALDNVPVSTCLAGDANGDNKITIDEILTAANNALTRCGG